MTTTRKPLIRIECVDPDESIVIARQTNDSDQHPLVVCVRSGKDVLSVGCTRDAARTLGRALIAAADENETPAPTGGHTDAGWAFGDGALSVCPNPALPGVYRHHKGGLYRVLMMTRNATNAGGYAWMVVYVSMTGGEVFARDLGEFGETVTCSDGERRPRFAWVSEAEMAPGKVAR